MSRRIAQLEFAVGAILLAIITLLVFFASIMRFLGSPVIWSVDVAQLLFIWLCFVGATRAMRERAHLGVDLIVRWFPHRVRLYIEIGLAIVFIVFMVLLAKEGYQLTLMNSERLFGDSGLSYAYVTIAVPVGAIFLSLSVIANGWEAWRRRREAKTLIFTRTEILPEIHEEV
jgi:TRAP-type transport system small permease protein